MSLVDRVNKLFDGELKVARVEKYGLVMSGDIENIMPFKPIAVGDSIEMIERIREDVDMIVRLQKKDERVEMVNKNELKDAYFKSIWNELVSFVKRQKNVREQFNFLRNPLNPIPMAFKLSIAHKLAGGHLGRVVSKGGLLNPISSFHNKMCSNIGKKKECNGQCNWFDVLRDGKRLGGKCKLVAPRDLYDMLVTRVLLHALNVNVTLKQISVVDKKEGDNVLVFTDADIKNGRLQKLFQESEDIDAWGLQKKIVQLKDSEYLDMHLQASQEPEPSKAVKFELGPSFRNIPVGLRDKLKGFDVNEANPYGPMTLFQLFANVYNYMNVSSGQATIDGVALKSMVRARIVADWNSGKATSRKKMLYNRFVADALKKRDEATLEIEDFMGLYDSEQYYASDYEVSLMAEICQVNVFVWGRSGQRNPDNTWCLGKFSNALYTILMEQTVKEVRLDKKRKIDVYEMIVKQKQKVMMEPDDLTNEMKALLGKKCARVRI